MALFHDQVIKKDTIVAWRKNILTSLFSIIVILLLLEIVFTLIPRSHGVGFAYAAKNWNYFYLNKNDQGYRDSPLSEKDLTKETLLFLGDSFTEGAGINDPADRFANLFYEEVKKCYEMVIYAKGGMNTVDQLDIVKNLDFTPSKIIFQYYGNDIEGDAINLGKFRGEFFNYADINLPTQIIVRSSFFFNYLYWLFPRNFLDGYTQYLIDSYQDPVFFSHHENTLKELLRHCKSHEIDLYCIVIPFLQDISGSQEIYLDKITALLNNDTFNSQVIPILSAIEEIPTDERIVNSNDSHANEKINLVIKNNLKKAMPDLCNE